MPSVRLPTVPEIGQRDPLPRETNDDRN